MTRNTVTQWLPLALFALILFSPLRTPVLGTLQRGLLATGLWQADVPVAPAATPSVSTGGAAYPHNVALTTFDGKAVSLRNLQDKVVFVNLWASWCPPCVAEMPGIEALYKKMDPRKVAFVMISLDENPARARALLARKAYTFPVYFPAGPLPPPFDSNSIPSTVILTSDGQVAARHDGMADYDTPEFKAALDNLAQQPRPYRATAAGSPSAPATGAARQPGRGLFVIFVEI